MDKIKILIIGGGGREHAVGWKVAQSPRAGEILFAPGNAGTMKIGKNLDIDSKDMAKLVEYAKAEKVDLTLALPDDPLALGIVDEFQNNGLRIWGPSKAASELEWSKAYAKDFMHRHHIPTANYKVFHDFEEARDYIEKGAVPVVVKVSGLALGKGVTVAHTHEEAIDALQKIFIDKVFGHAGNEVVIEEYLAGHEISIHAFSDGKTWKMFPVSQDHKRIFDYNNGPNTGGMGVITPVPMVDEQTLHRIENEIIKVAIEGMAQEGRPFVGCLYPGIMITHEGPKVFEFNARFGDPETESYMRILDTDLLDIFDACIDGKLSDLEISWSNKYACTVMMASAGYPGPYEKGQVISGTREAEQDENVVVFHSGTKLNAGDQLVTNGGRVLGVSAIGDTLNEAIATAYAGVFKINFTGMQYRKDIGKKHIH